MAKKDKGKGKSPDKGKDKGSAKKPSLKELFNSMTFKKFSPGLQDAIKIAYDEFDVADLPKLNLSNKEFAGILTQTAKRINPYYDKQENDLWLDYDEAKGSTIDTIQTGIQREMDSLNKNSQNGRDDLAEGNRIALQNLEQSLQKETEDRDRYMNEKKADLQTKISDARTKLSQGLGDFTADEVQELQNEQRRFEQEFKSIQKEETDRGYAFSGERIEKERYSIEGSEATKSMTRTEAERLRRDLSQEQEDLVGTDNLKDIAGARLRGGIIGSDVVTTGRDIETAMRGAGVNMETYLKDYESQYGTQAAQELASRYGINMLGGLEGSEVKTERRVQEDNQTTYKNYVADKLKSFGQDYGTDEVNTTFTPGYGAAGSYAGATPQQANYGGSVKRAYDANKSDIKYNRKNSLVTAIQTKKAGIIGSRKI